MHRYGTDEEIGRVLRRHGFDNALKEMGIDAKNPPNIRAVLKQRYEEQFLWRRLGEEAGRLKLVCGCVESYSLRLDQWKRTRTSLKERY